MAIAILTGKGQMTIPKDIRERLNLKPGDRLEFVVQEDGTLLLVPATVSLSALRECLPPPRRHLTLEEIDETIRDQAVARARRAGQ